MSMEELVQSHYRLLGESDRAVSRFVLANPQEAAGMSIQQLAKASLTSKSSVMRFAQKLGFSGFSEMKVYLRWETGVEQAPAVPTSLQAQVIQDAEKTLAYIGETDFSPLYAAMAATHQFYIIATGVSQQGQAAELQRLLHLIGKPVQVLPASATSNEYRRAMENLTGQDMLFLLSLSGENPGLKDLLEIPLLKGAKLVSVTNFKSNWLAQNADFHYYAASSQSPVPRNWWMQSSSAFFLLLEAMVFGFLEYTAGS